MSINLASLLWKAADTRPDHPAVVTRDAQASWADVRRQASDVAEFLRATGATPGDRVALLLDRASAIAPLFGVFAAGLVATVINDRLRARQIEHQLQHSGARLLLTSREMLERLHRPLVTKTTILDIAATPAARLIEALARAEHDPAQIIYTSGSTGLPRGAVFTHRALLTGAAIVNQYLGQQPDDRIASLLALSTVYGLNQVLTATACGATLVIEGSPLAAEIIASLQKERVTVLAAVPPLWLQLLSVNAFSGPNLPTLRLLQNAGGHLPVEAVRRLREAIPKADLYLQYGQTETFRGTFLPPSEVDRRPGSMGRAIPLADLLVIRSDGTAAAPGETGELVHAGPTIASGYWNDPEATKRTFREHPDPARAALGERAVYSGDLVRRDEEGFFTFVSRADRLIKTMGFRVGPDEVADVLHASGMIREVVVTSEPDPERGERIVALVILHDNATVAGLTRYCRAELPPYMVPSRIEAVATLPRLPSGKYDVAALRASLPQVPQR